MNRFGRFGNRNIEVLEWITIVTEELKNGLISTTIDNTFRFKFDKKKFKKMEQQFFLDL